MLARRLLVPVGGGESFASTVETGPDFEFNAPLDSQWRLVDNGSAFVLDVNDTVAGNLYIEGPGVGIVRPCPAIPFTVTARISAVDNDASTFSDCGVMLGEATPGAFIHGCLDVAILGHFTILGSLWASPYEWLQNIHDNPITLGGTPPVPHYSRFTVNTQNDVDGYYSTDGSTWSQWLNAYNPPFTIGSVGLDLHGTGTSFAVDWLRFT